MLTTRGRLLAAFGACAVLALLLNGLLRVAAKPDERSLTDPGVYNPGARTYATWADWTARETGDLAPVWDAMVGLAEEGWDHDLYRPRELEAEWAAFVYTPPAAVALRPLHATGFDRAATVVSVANHLLALGGLLALAAVLTRGRREPFALAVFAGCALAFYPLAQALNLTQVGVWIFALLAIATWLHDRDRPLAFGALLGVGAFLKPHLLVVPVALALAGRFPRRALVGSATAAGLALLGSLVVAGPGNLVDYATVQLPRLSAGYAFAPNQSVQAFLQRVLTDADPSVLVLAEPHGLQWAGRIAALVLVGAAVAAGRGRPRGREADLRLFAAAVAAATLASPVCWLHNYAMLAIPLVVGASALRGSAAARRGGLDVAFLACGALASVFLDASGAPRWLTGLELAGALGLLVCMLVLVRREEPAGC